MLATEVPSACLVGLLPVPAVAALLAGAAGIRRDNGYPRRSSLVARRKDQRASEDPRVQTSPLPLASLHAVARIGQVLEDQGCVGLHRLDHGLGRHVVAVPAETSLAIRHPARVPLGRPCGFRLQRTTPAERTSFDFTPVALAKERGLRGHGGARRTKINAYLVSHRRNFKLLGLDDGMAPKSTPAIHAEAGRTNGYANTSDVAWRDGRYHPLAPGDMRQGGVSFLGTDFRTDFRTDFWADLGADLGMDLGRPGGVANGRVTGAGARNLPGFAPKHAARRDSFLRFRAGAANPLRRECGCRAFGREGLVVKLHAAEARHSPSHGADATERCGVLRDGVTHYRTRLPTHRCPQTKRRTYIHIPPQRGEGAAIPPPPQRGGPLAAIL